MKNLIITLSVIMSFSAFAHADDWQSHHYTVTRVVDGDTAEATDGNIKFKVRFAGMDAPEHDQDFGNAAKQKLSDLILNKQIEIKPVGNGIDIYGRSLGQVFTSGKDVSLTMIQSGLAIYYRPTCEDFPAASNKYNYDPRIYVDAEAKARKDKLAIWSSDKFELPCKFRHEKKAKF